MKRTLGNILSILLTAFVLMPAYVIYRVALGLAIGLFAAALAFASIACTGKVRAACREMLAAIFTDRPAEPDADYVAANRQWMRYAVTLNGGRDGKGRRIAAYNIREIY